jgi:hypothetical protein
MLSSCMFVGCLGMEVNVVLRRAGQMKEAHVDDVLYQVGFGSPNLCAFELVSVSPLYVTHPKHSLCMWGVIQSTASICGVSSKAQPLYVGCLGMVVTGVLFRAAGQLCRRDEGGVQD